MPPEVVRPPPNSPRNEDKSEGTKWQASFFPPCVRVRVRYVGKQRRKRRHVRPSERSERGRETDIGGEKEREGQRQRKRRKQIHRSRWVEIRIEDAEAEAARRRGSRSNPLSLRLPWAEENRSDETLRREKGMLGTGRERGLRSWRDQGDQGWCRFRWLTWRRGNFIIFSLSNTFYFRRV